MRPSELIPATIFVFRTKGKFGQPPLAWYLDDVLECIMDKVFLFDRFVLRKFPLDQLICHCILSFPAMESHCVAFCLLLFS